MYLRTSERVGGCSITYVVSFVISEEGPPFHWRFLVVWVACDCGSIDVAVVLRYELVGAVFEQVARHELVDPVDPGARHAAHKLTHPHFRAAIMPMSRPGVRQRRCEVGDDPSLPS